MQGLGMWGKWNKIQINLRDENGNLDVLQNHKKKTEKWL